jgi:ABC-type nitrate/sulfonate/bicarbonate transport system ATPase subunit
MSENLYLHSAKHGAAPPPGGEPLEKIKLLMLTDLLDLWMEHRLPTKSMLLVTHNIEEAVFMCDRILLFSSNPGRVSAVVIEPTGCGQTRACAGRAIFSQEKRVPHNGIGG